jgi:hypothetical protein
VLVRWKGCLGSDEPLVPHWQLTEDHKGRVRPISGQVMLILTQVPKVPETSGSENYFWFLCVRPVCCGRRCSRPTTRCSHAQRQRGQEVDPVRKGPRESPCRGQGIWHPHVSACSFFSVLRPERKPQKMIFLHFPHPQHCKAASFLLLATSAQLAFSFFSLAFLASVTAPLLACNE